MNKTLLASAIAVSLGCTASVQAQTITATQMIVGGIPNMTTAGFVNDSATGVMNSIQPFFGQPWTATQQKWFDTHSSPLTWSGGFSAGISSFTYTFHLTGNQVAAGVFFDWNASTSIPMLTIYDCPVTGGGACTGNSLPVVSGPFPGAQFNFNGVTADDFPVSGVPVPAAVWLMGSGLIGLISLARRKHKI
jgi:hypothetical protein